MTIDIPAKIGLTRLEAELKRDLKQISDRNPIKVKVDLNNNNLAIKLRRAMIEAQKRMGEMRIRVANPQVRLQVDRQHLIAEIRAALASADFRIRVNARDADVRRARGGGGGGSRSEHRGLSAIGDFARAAIPGLGAMYAFSKSNDISQRVTAANNSLEAVSGNEATYNSNRNFINNLSNEQGMNFRDVAPQFSSIYQAAASKIGTKGVQDMYRGISKYGTTHGLSADNMKGVGVALSQMFGKGKIQSEELRQQLGDRMPNAMNFMIQAAKNMKVGDGTTATFDKLMQAGKLDPIKLLPEFARVLEQAADANGAYAKSLETTRVAQGRMNKEFEDSVMLFSKGGFDKGMGHFFNTVASSMKDAAPLIEGLGKAFEVLSRPINAILRLAGALGAVWPDIAKSLGLTTGQLTTLAAAIGIFLLPFGGFITALGVAAMALDDFVTYMRGGDSVFGDLVRTIPGAQEHVDSIGQSFQGIVKILGDVLDKLGPVGEAFKGLTFNDAFLATLNLVDSVLANILKTMQLIQAISNGDGKAANTAAKGINLTGGYTTYNRVADMLGGDDNGSAANTAIADNYAKEDSGPGFWSRLGDWMGKGASQRGSLYSDVLSGNNMPTTYSGQVDRSTAQQQAPVVNVGGVSLNVTAPEGKDAETFAQELSPHFETLMSNAWNKAMGNARSLQAER